ADEIYKRMSALMPGIRFKEGETLIFLDEIQKCAKARTALKFLAEDGRYDMIASGSLLGLHYGQDADSEVDEVESIPVGYERPLVMYSLDFMEFLWAYGYEDAQIDYLRSFYENREKVPDDVNEKFGRFFLNILLSGECRRLLMTLSAERTLTASSFCRRKSFLRMMMTLPIMRKGRKKSRSAAVMTVFLVSLQGKIRSSNIPPWRRSPPPANIPTALHG
ncbi:MAG: AAA family ATPase, partial [Treponema sp.]|nr:AAA family ATPase [Treponema sp.]